MCDCQVPGNHLDRHRTDEARQGIQDSVPGRLDSDCCLAPWLV